MNILSAGVKSVVDLWYRNAENQPDKEAVVHWCAGEAPFRWNRFTLLQRANAYAGYIKAAGVSSGEVCALIIRHNKEFYPLYMGVCISGAIPAVLAYPNPRLHPDKFREGIEGMAQRSGLDWILTEDFAGDYLAELINTKRTTIKGLLFPLQENVEKYAGGVTPIQENYFEDPLLLQHSSGTTGLQKPVLLINGAVLKHLQNYAEAVQLSDTDKVISWLPLYHDMGLIAAFHLPLAFGIPLVQIDPFEWVTIPSLLPEAVSSEKGSISWLPNFAYNILADKVRDEDISGISLKSWRLIINCSEPVKYESHLRFIKKYKKYGLNEKVLSSSYAMAETTFAVTQSPPGEGVKELTVNPSEFGKGRIVLTMEGRKILSSGRPIKGCTLQVRGSDGLNLPSGHIGELVVTSDSLFSGYRNYPEKTSEVLFGEWYTTGDLGFEHEGYYYITGRKKDVIIVAGNNIYPEDIEALVSEIDGIIPGRVIAAGEFDPDLGSEQIIIIAETTLTEETDITKLKEMVIKKAMSIDITIQQVYFVPPRWLIKSSAGKPARKANAERIKTIIL